MALLALAGCRSYAPAPLDPVKHQTAWHARDLELAGLEELERRLDPRWGQRSTGFDATDGLTLEEGQLVALVFQPALRLARQRLALAQVSAEQASRWADPQLGVTALHVTDNVPDPWVLIPSLAFTIPLSGRLEATQALADADSQVQQSQVLEQEWQVWNRVHEDWVEWSAAGLRIEATDDLIASLGELVKTSAGLTEAGELNPLEASLFALELDRQRLARLGWLRDQAVHEQHLRAQLGLAPEVALELVPSLRCPDLDPQAGSNAPQQLAERNPTLVRLRHGYESAERALRLEYAEQVPDLTLGPQVESDAGQTRIGLFGGIPLPFFNANARGIAEASAQRQLARASLETEYERLVGRWSVAYAEAQGASAQRTQIEDVLGPRVQRQLDDALRLLSLGETSSLVLLESLRQANRTELQRIDLRAQEALARIRMQTLVGPPGAQAPAANPQ